MDYPHPVYIEHSARNSPLKTSIVRPLPACGERTEPLHPENAFHHASTGVQKGNIYQSELYYTLTFWACPHEGSGCSGVRGAPSRQRRDRPSGAPSASLTPGRRPAPEALAAAITHSRSATFCLKMINDNTHAAWRSLHDRFTSGAARVPSQQCPHKVSPPDLSFVRAKYVPLLHDS